MSRNKKQRKALEKEKKLDAQRKRWKRRSSKSVSLASDPGSKAVVCVACGLRGVAHDDDTIEILRFIGCPRCKSTEITFIA